MSSAKRYEALDGIRALACMGIVAMHVLENAKYNLGGFVYKDIIPSFTNLVFLFMTISGFGMCCGYFDKMISKNLDIADFYKKRYKKILPFFALLCLMDFAMSPSIESLYEVFANVTLCFGLIPNAKITVIGVGWFLGTVFAFYLLFPFFCFLLADKKRAWLGFVSSCIMNYICSNYFGVSRKAIVYSFVFFMAGGMVFLFRENIKETKLTHVITLGLILVLIFGYFTLPIKTLIMVALNVVVLIYAMGVSEKHFLTLKPLKMLGGISFEVYLCHMLVFRVVEKIHLLRVFSNDYINYLIVYIAVLVGAVIFALIGQRFINLLFNCLGKRS